MPHGSNSSAVLLRADCSQPAAPIACVLPGAARLRGVLRRRDLLPDIARSLVRLPDRAAHGLLIRDLNTWVRVEFLGVMAHTGIAEALRRPRTLGELLDDTGASDSDLLEALLGLGISLREIRLRSGRYHARGRRLRAMTGSSPAVRAFAEELIVYGNRVYTAFDAHLRGAPPVAYDADCGAVIAASSRIAEPILGSAVRVVARSERPDRVLDIGCGSGVYLRHILEVAPNASGVGVDLNAGAIGVASEMLHELRSQGRCELRHGDIQELAGEIGTFDLVTLLNNIYYWPPAQRAETLRAIRAVVSPGALLLLATATTDGEAYNLHLDLMLRVTASSHRLPTRKEITVDLADAGFVDIETIEPVPKSGFLVATARNPAAS